MAIHDLIFTVNKAGVIFSALTPKGEEFLQTYLINDVIVCDEMTMFKYKWLAENLKLTVDIVR